MFGKTISPSSPTINKDCSAPRHKEDRLALIENAIDHHQQQLVFVIRANEKPEEIIIPTGCVWDGYTFV